MLKKNKKGELVDVTGSKEDMMGFLKMKTVNYGAGCGGLYGTLEDYDHLGICCCITGIITGYRF